MAAKTFKLDIFKILANVSKKAKTTFSDDEMKSIHPPVIMRWMSGTSNIRQIIILNETANRFCFSLYGHKELLLNLLKISSDGRYVKYAWYPRIKSGTSSKLAIDVVSKYYDMPTRHAADQLELLSSEVILEFANELGYQKDEVTKLKKELKTRK